MARFWTADPHFGHQNIIKYCNRPYMDVETMNEGLIENWNSVVGPKDEVYILGDFSMVPRITGEIAHRLNGFKKLIPGNHDACHPMHRKAEKQAARYTLDGLIVIGWKRELTLADGTNVLMTHMPYENPSGRYPEWHPKNQGMWLLHGHVHENWKVRGRQINVGVDVWDYKPVSEEEIIATIRGASHSVTNASQSDDESPIIKCTYSDSPVDVKAPVTEDETMIDARKTSPNRGDG